MTGLTQTELLTRLREWQEDIANGFGGECDDLGGSDDWCCLRHRQRHADLALAIAALEQRERVKKIIRSIAQRKTCEEDPEHCESQSGPYCSAHNWWTDEEELITSARLALLSDGPGET